MSIQDYANFEINIELLDGGKIRVTVIDSPVGSASADVANPFTADEIAQIIGTLDGSLKVSRSERNQAARKFGEKLFSTIFSDQIFAAYLTSLERAGSSGLRIKLGLESAGDLRRLPWELLRDPRTDYLALSRQTAVIRYPRLITVRPLVEVALPLRVLVLISSPADQEPLDVEGEWRALQDSTAELRSRGLLEIERIDNAQLITLQHKLREGTSYQVFHYIGHAAFDERSQTGLLAFENPKTNGSTPVSGEALARELVEENSIRLVILNACQGARQNDKDPFTGIASSLVARGVPAVVAMQFAISDDASRIFSQEFYRALSEGYPIEASIAEARRAISSTLNNVEWATPVLFLRAPTGILFPKRKASDTRISTGGLREVLRSPLGIGIGVLAVFLVAVAALLLRSPTPVTPTLTATTAGATLTPTSAVTEAATADLGIVSVLFRPPHPAPGGRVSVTIQVENDGPAPVGSFKLTWTVSATGTSKSISLQTSFPQALGESEPLAITGHFRFGWWGVPTTTALITTTDRGVVDPNPTNQFKALPVTMSTKPFDVDFTLLPADLQTSSFTGEEPTIATSRDLKGDEFTPWGFQIAPIPAAGDSCSKAIPKISVTEDINSLITGLSGQDDVCSNLPIVFTIVPPDGTSITSIGGAAILFSNTGAGRYSLELFDADGNSVLKQTKDVAASDQLVWLRAPATGNGLPAPTLENGKKDIRKIIFRTSGGATIIQRLILYLPDIPLAPLPTLDQVSPLG